MEKNLVPTGGQAKRRKRGKGSALHPRPPAPPILSDPEETAAALNISRRTLENWKADGVIPCIKVGHVIRYHLPTVLLALGRFQINGAAK